MRDTYTYDGNDSALILSMWMFWLVVGFLKTGAWIPFFETRLWM